MVARPDSEVATTTPSPSASALDLGVYAVVAGGYALAGADPYLNLGSQMAGVGSLAVIVLILSPLLTKWMHREADEGPAAGGDGGKHAGDRVDAADRHSWNSHRSARLEDV